ncbi:TraB/GumN family protein [Pedobacter sp. GSP4]|uniref:TraB/GumN family protein n=1 Tax=Pedobacter sp. GSP4 TaxID=3453716 RepID=UPI003EE94025
MKPSFSFGVHSKAFSLVFVLFFIVFSSFSQEKKPSYNLLWKISGKGLAKPSYLFGSMHVKDKRAFNFSDSVMKAIAASDGFVLEVHPDSLIRSIFDSAVQKDNKRKITNLITAEQTAELIKRFEAQNGYTPDSALLDNPVLVASLMKHKEAKKDDMQTFVDAYLYGMARTMKKKIYGLEKPQDQVNLLYGSDEKIASLFDVDEEAENENLEKMVSMYAKGNLEAISAYLNSESEVYLNINARNKVMADGILKMIRSNTVFVAVGAAHLPGEQGVINLLKKQGYTLQPVKADFTGVAKTFKIDYSKMDWVKHRDVVNNFEAEFPAQPFVSKQIISTAVTSSDLVTNVLYTINTTYTGPLVNMTPIQYLDTVLTAYQKKGTRLISKKAENRFGGTGFDIEMEVNNKFTRSILIHKNSTFYIINVENEQNNLHEAFVEKFFSSFKITDPVTAKNGSWLDYKHSVGGFSLKIPMQPEEVIKEVPNPAYTAFPYIMNIYTMLDKVNFVSYLFKYNDFPEGMYLADKATVFDGTISQLQKSGKIVDGPLTIYKNGLEGREVGLLLQGTYMKVQVFLRGNRTYLLMKQNQVSADKPKDDEFFSSFKLEKYAEGKSASHPIEDIQVFTPGKPNAVEPNNEKDYTSIIADNNTYYSLNKNTGGLYMIETGNLSKYFKAADMDSVYLAMINKIKKEKDTIHKIENAMVGTAKAKVFTYTDSAAGMLRKAKMWINGGRFYYQGLMATNEELEGKQATEFFNAVSTIVAPKPFDIKASKAKQLFDDLKSKDSLVFKPAFGALSYYEFDKTEVPLMISALNLKYADDTLNNGTRVKLIRELSALQKEKCIPLLKELFADTKNTDIIRSRALTEVVNLDSNQYDWYLKNLSDGKALQLESYWSIFRPLKDSLGYVAKHFDQVLALKDKAPYRSNILGLVADMVDSEEPAYLAQVKSNKEKISAGAMADLAAYLADKQNNFPTLVYSYLDILPILDLPKLTDAFTQKIIADTVPYLVTQAMVARIKANLPLNQKLLSAQLDSLSSRYDILLAYDAKQSLDLVPAKYKSQEEIAKVLLYNYAGEEQDYPNSITLLDKVVKDGKTYYVFEFTSGEGEEKSSYVGVCGPFDDKSNKINFKEYYCNSDFEPKDENWREKAKTLIAQIEEE